MLTAAHVVAPAGPPLTTVQVRDRDGELRLARVAWLNPALDVALVEVTDRDWVGTAVEGAGAMGSPGHPQPGPRCDVRGFPAVVASPQMRDGLDTTGLIRPGSRARPDCYALDVDNPPAPMDGGSRWAGMSGAAVIQAGLHRRGRRAGPGRVRQPPTPRRPHHPRSSTTTRFRAWLSSIVAVSPTRSRSSWPGSPNGSGGRRPRPPACCGPTSHTPTFRPRPELDRAPRPVHRDALDLIRLVHGPGGQGKTRLGRHLTHTA